MRPLETCQEIVKTTWFWTFTKLAVAVGVMGFLLQQGSLDLRLFLDGAIDFRIVVVALGLNMGMISLGALRWHILLRSQGIRLPFSWSHRMTYLAMCFNLLVPGAVGGDALRMGYVARQAATTHKGAAILTILMDRFIGLYALFVIAFVALISNGPSLLTVLPLRVLGWALAGVVLGGPLMMMLVLWSIPRLARLRDHRPAPSHPLPTMGQMGQMGQMGTLRAQTAHAIQLFGRAKGHLMAALTISWLAQWTEILALLWIANELKMLTVPAETFFVAAPLAWVANVLPVAPGGLGVGEAAFSQVCQWQHPTQSATALGTVFLINRMIQMGASLPGLWVYLGDTGKKTERN